MSDIEKFFKENKEAFDTLEPDASAWEGLDTKLDAKAEQPRNNWWKIAAGIILLIGVSIAAFYVFQEQEEQQSHIVGLEEGMTFPNLQLRSPDGELIPISSLEGKIVLVEFWASYSKICTEENCYFFQPIYNEFKNKGFEIYGVSVDTSAVEWIKGINRDELPWIQVADLGSAQPELIKKYAINELPTTFLLDQNGKIIAKDINADELETKLNELLVYK
jgi:peroxiredoxin